MISLVPVKIFDHLAICHNEVDNMHQSNDSQGQGY